MMSSKKQKRILLGIAIAVVLVIIACLVIIAVFPGPTGPETPPTVTNAPAVISPSHNGQATGRNLVVTSGNDPA